MSKKDFKDISKFNILHDNVLVKTITVNERNGVYRPSQYEDKAFLGEVLSVGPGRTLENGTVVPLTVKAGDTVYFNKYSTTQFEVEGKEYVIVREEDIVAYV